MPYETLRFIHAARTLVDQPLQQTGPIDPPLQKLARDATTLAFRRLIDTALQQDVDFLLLTGDALDQSDFSIKARVELRRGFQQLADAGIQVFLIPGQRDPSAVWDEFPGLPANVTVFHPERDDPVAVVRDGAVIASIRALDWKQPWFEWDDEEPHVDRNRCRAKEADDVELTALPGESSRSVVRESDDPELTDTESAAKTSAVVSGSVKHDPQRDVRRVQAPAELRPDHFAIAIVRAGIDQPGASPQADYLAVVGGRERATTQGAEWLMHFPGGTQGVSPAESGQRGCSLVELESDGVIRCRFLPCATVRWESPSVTVEPQTTTQELLSLMLSECRGWSGVQADPPRRVLECDDPANDLASAAPPPAETQAFNAEACVLTWTIRGHGPLFQSLFDESARTALIDPLQRHPAWPVGLPGFHRFRLLAIEPGLSRTTASDADQIDVAAEFFWRIDQAEALGSSSFSDVVATAIDGPERLARVQAAVPEFDAAVVFSLARRRGWNWFKS